VPDVLDEVLRRVDLDRPRFTFAERRRIPDDAWGRVADLGLVRRIEDAEWVKCTSCGEGEDVVFAPTAPGRERRAYSHCRENGTVRIDVAQLQQWDVDLARLAQALAEALSCGGRVEELVPGRLWALGRIAVHGRTREVFFATRLAAEPMFASSARLQSAIAPVVLVAGVVPDRAAWGAGVPTVLTIPTFVALGEGSLAADQDFVVSALTVASPAAASPSPDADACVFRAMGRTWFLAFEGLARSVEDSLGMRYVAELLRTPGVEVHSVRLRDVVAREEPRALGNAGEVLDTEALRQIKERLDANREDEDEARERQDFARVERLQEEAEFLRAEVTRATGLAGRRRRASDDHERARQAVAQAVRRALAAISREHEPLGRHLSLSVRTGTTLAYDPAPVRVWTM